MSRRNTFTITDGAMAAVIDAYPRGATNKQIADALGLSQMVVRRWARAAFKAFRSAWPESESA